VVDRAVDAFDVVQGNSVPGFSISSQDMASCFCGARAY
jgi:hypothetical protein